MCGRYALSSTSRELINAFSLLECVDFGPRYNIAPLQSVPVIRQRATGERVGQMLRWGLLPSWAKDEAMASKLINARSETVAEKPSFRSAYKARRCIIPANGYYEWKAIPGGKQPYFIHPAEGNLLAMAGLWERWNKPDSEALDTFTVITTASNEATREVHDRMPVILKPADFGLWLSRETPLELVNELLHPAIEVGLAMYQVAKLVGNVRNDGPECLEPLRP